MANQTIEGCVDWTSGQVIFDGDACDGGDYTGCINWTGAHAGMVAVVVDEDNCDATYYGCVDWTSGKFELIIPDDCCSGDYALGNDCDLCETDLWADGATPKYVKIVIQDILGCPATGLCTNSDCTLMNGTYYAIQIGGSEPCRWSYVASPLTHRISWELVSGHTNLTGLIYDGFDKAACFRTITAAECSDAADSTLGDVGDFDCGDAIDLFSGSCGTGGSAEVTWGAGIGQTQYDAQF